jgi:hypothetical protein
MKRLLLGILLASVIAACESDDDRATSLGRQGEIAVASGDPAKAIGLFDQALALRKRDSFYIGRAEAVAKTAGEAKAAESLTSCGEETCAERRRELARAALEKLGAKPMTDGDSLKKYLSLQTLAGNDSLCALLLALAAAPKPDPGLRAPVQAAIQAEIARTKQRLGGVAVDDPSLDNAKSAGAALADDTDCESLANVETRMARLEATAPGYPSETRIAAFRLGLLNAKLDAITNPSAGANPAPDPNWKNGGPCSAAAARLGDDQSCKTSKGALVARTRHGDVAGMRVLGRFWSDPLPKTYENFPRESAAAKACAALHMRLPSKQDFEGMSRAFAWDERGRTELRKLLPYSDDHFFWSSSSSKDGAPWGFLASYGSFDIVQPELSHAVTCIAR